MHSQRSSTSSRASIRQQELFNQLMLNTNNLQKNWKVDLTNLLDEYMSEIEMSQFSDEDILNTNFAEAALVLQNSVFIFGQKVKYFEQTVMDMHKSLSYTFMLRRQEMERRREAERLAEIENPTVAEPDRQIAGPSTLIDEPHEVPPEKPKREKKKPEQVPEQDDNVEVFVYEPEEEQEREEECDPMTLQNFLVPLFKKISRRIIDRDEDVDDDFHMKLPLFSNGLDKQLKHTCCEILENCLRPGRNLLQSLKEFFMVSQKNNNEDDHQWDLKLLAAKMMLLTEIKNNVNISVQEAPARIREYIKEYLKTDDPSVSKNINDTILPIVSTSSNDNMFPMETIAEISKVLSPTRDEDGDNTDMSIDESLSVLPVENFAVHLEKLSKKTICQYTRMNASELNKAIAELLNESKTGKTKKTNLNIFQIPQKYLKKRLLFQLPSEFIVEEKRKRLETKELRSSKRFKKSEEDVPAQSITCSLEEFERFQEKMMRNLNGNVDDFTSIEPEFEFDTYSCKDSCIGLEPTDDELFEPSDFDALLSSTKIGDETDHADSGIGLSQTSACMRTSQADSGIGSSQGDSGIDLTRNESAMSLSRMIDETTENHRSSTPIPGSDEPESAIVKIFNAISDVTHIHEQREKSVQEWYDLIEPRLEHSESRNFFNIEDYEMKIMDKFPSTSAKTTIRFNDVVEGESAAEVSRYFSAVLQMASDYKVDVAQNSTDKLPMDCVQLTNLTAERDFNERRLNHLEVSKNVFDKSRHYSYNGAVFEPEPSTSLHHYGPKKPPTGKKRPGRHTDYYS